MIYVSTIEENTWFWSNTGAIANWTIIFTILFQPSLRWHLFDTFCLKARKASLFSSSSFTWMTARMHFIAWLLHKFEACIFPTNVTESWFHTWRWLLELFCAESASFCLILLASLSCVIWFIITFGAEVLLTLITPDSIVSHVAGSFSWNLISFIVFLSSHDVSWHHLHDITTLTRYEGRILFYNLHGLIFLD